MSLVSPKVSPRVQVHSAEYGINVTVEVNLANVVGCIALLPFIHILDRF